MKQDIIELIENIKSRDICGNGKILLHEGSQIKIEQSIDYDWRDDEGNISIYVPKENLPRNMSSITYDLDNMENIIDKAIRNTQDKYNEEYCKIDENYAEECAKYADAENRGENDLDWANYVKPIADSLKENNCVAVPFWIGEHSSYSVSAGTRNDEFFTRDFIGDPSKSFIELEKEEKSVVMRTESGYIQTFIVDKDFDINSLKCDKDKIKKKATAFTQEIDKVGKEIKTDYTFAVSILEKLDKENKMKNYDYVTKNAPTGIAYINRDKFGDNVTDEEIEEILINNLENSFENYLNGYLYDVVVDDCREFCGLTDEELIDCLENDLGLKENENFEVVDENILNFLENHDDKEIEKIRTKIRKQ